MGSVFGGLQQEASSRDRVALEVAAEVVVAVGEAACLVVTGARWVKSCPGTRLRRELGLACGRET
jgi:hypothetical protein